MGFFFLSWRLLRSAHVKVWKEKYKVSICDKRYCTQIVMIRYWLLTPVVVIVIVIVDVGNLQVKNRVGI